MEAVLFSRNHHTTRLIIYIKLISYKLDCEITKEIFGVAWMLHIRLNVPNKRGEKMKKLACLFAVLMGLAMFTSLAMAVPIPCPTIAGSPCNLDPFMGTGTLVFSTGPSDFISSAVGDIGDLSSAVYDEGGGVFRYELEVTPGIDNISEFNAGYNVLGFLGPVAGAAGFSFSQAVAAGLAPPPGFNQFLDSDGSIDWETLGGGDPWDTGETITFFFRSTFPPGVNKYNLINVDAGPATAAAPVPEPASLILLGSGLAGLGFWARRRFKKGMDE
jgi:hypothetical protein